MMTKTDWQNRHLEAWNTPNGKERPLVNMIKSWAAYAYNHARQNGNGIGEDYVLGDEWAKMGFCLRALLNGDFGQRLDGGSMDKLICGLLREQGWNCDTEERS